jgi:hypothetical protein
MMIVIKKYILFEWIINDAILADLLEFHGDFGEWTNRETSRIFH